MFFFMHKYLSKDHNKQNTLLLHSSLKDCRGEGGEGGVGGSGAEGEQVLSSSVGKLL